MAFDFMTVMARAATDAGERASFLEDPRAYLMANGLDLPAYVIVNATEIEGSAPTFSLGIPPMLEDGELSEQALEGVAGGSSCCTMIRG